MPEQLTKYPDVTIQVLQTGGAQCGEGAEQKILRACPPASFCKLPGGEICVYGLPDAAKMTQIKAADWTSLTNSLQLPSSGPFFGASTIGAVVVALLAGAAIGLLVSRRRKATN